MTTFSESLFKKLVGQHSHMPTMATLGQHHTAAFGVAIARGRARLLVRAATGRALWGSGGRKGRQGKDAKRPSPLSTEWDQHSC